MSRRRKKKKTTVSTWEDKTIHVETKIVEILEKNVWYEKSQKFKCAFYCNSANNGKRLCVAWQRFPTIEQGDTVSMTGYINNDVFLIKTLLVITRKEQSEI
jgi:hypothetical protein